MYTVTFSDKASKREIYSISVEAASKAQAVGKAHRVAYLLGYNVNDRHVVHAVR